MGGNPFANMGGPLGMAGGGMGMGMGGGFGGGEDLGLANRGAGNAMGMGMGMGMGGAMSPPWWDMMMGLEEEEEDDDEAFWEEEGEMPEVFTSYLKGLRGRRKSHGFGGTSSFASLCAPRLFPLLRREKLASISIAVLASASMLEPAVADRRKHGDGIEPC